MPRNGSGVMSWPPNTQGVPNTKVSSTRYNAFLADLLQDLNAARPINAGGTGGNTAISGNDGLNTTGADMPSAGTLNLGSATGVVVNVTGTTTITALGTVNSGAIRTLVFAGALTLTHNATSLILPGAANIATAAGDVATFRSKGAGNWVCVGYQRANGGPVSGVLTSPTTITSTDASATGGPDLDLFRNSASPAAADVLARVLFNGEDSAGNKELYALIQALLIDPTSTSEDAQIDFQTVIAGALASRMKLGAGLIVGSPTGGDPGPGKANLTEVQQDGVAIRPRILSASVATTSGTSFDFTSIPSWAKEIRIGLVGVSLSGTDDLLVQIGSGSVDTTGYSATCVNTLSPNALATVTSTAGFNLVGGDAAGLFNGTIILTLVDAATNTWNVLSTASPTSVRVVIGAGTKSVSGVIDRARLTRSGSNTFDAGKASITVIG